MRRGPLVASYPAAVALVVFSLIPYLALTAAVLPLLPDIAKGTGLSEHALVVTIACSTGAYAAGTVLAVQFAVHLRPRRMLVGYEVAFVAASVLAAWAPTPSVFVAAFITQGLCTSLMLIGAVPPLVTRWPADKMPVTGAIMNLCIFGAVALGPTVGAALERSGGWRPVFWAVAVVAGMALVFSILTFDDDPAHDRGAPWDLVALALAVLGCGLAFFGAGRLQAMATGPAALAPLAVGTALVGALVVYEYVQKNPLMPVKVAATTVPATGLLVALTASAAAFGLTVLVLQSLQRTDSPATVALVFLPEFAGAIVVAGLFGVLFRTRYTPLLALGGLVAVGGAAGVFLAGLPAGGPSIAAGTGLLGLGVAASVSPALFMAGFSLRSPLLQRVFALIELMRGVTAFLVAPILVFLAAAIGGGSAGIRAGIWICLGIAGAGLVGGGFLYLSGKRSLEAPDLERWHAGDEPAWQSPALFARWRDWRPRSRHEGTGTGALEPASVHRVGHALDRRPGGSGGAHPAGPVPHHPTGAGPHHPTGAGPHHPAGPRAHSRWPVGVGEAGAEAGAHRAATRSRAGRAGMGRAGQREDHDMADGLAGRKIAFLVANEGIEQVELTRPWDAVQEAGGQPVLAAPDEGRAQAFHHLDRADTFGVDVTTDRLEVGDFAGIVLPGGVANPDRLRTDPGAVSFVRAFFEAGKPAAAICHGPWTLVEAGVVRGRRLTSWPSLRTDISNAGGEWVDEELVECTEGPNTLLTSRKPDDLDAFCRAIVRVFAGQSARSAA